MRFNTHVHFAIRNIGDSQDTGRHFEGPLVDAMKFMFEWLKVTSMAGRIVMGLGRTKEDALKGIDIKGAGRAALTPDISAMLDSLLDGVDDSVTDRPNILPADYNRKQTEHDDYVA